MSLCSSKTYQNMQVTHALSMLSNLASLSTKESTEYMHVLSDRFMSMIGNNVILETSVLGLLYSLVVYTKTSSAKTKTSSFTTKTGKWNIKQIHIGHNNCQSFKVLASPGLDNKILSSASKPSQNFGLKTETRRSRQRLMFWGQGQKFGL